MYKLKCSNCGCDILRSKQIAKATCLRCRGRIYKLKKRIKNVFTGRIEKYISVDK